jgi:hypothetical protein
VLDGRAGERAVLVQHALLGPQRVGGAVAREVDGQRPASAPAEQVERAPPGVGGVGEAVQEQQRRAVALELQRARPHPAEPQPMLDEGLAH